MPAKVHFEFGLDLLPLALTVIIGLLLMAGAMAVYLRTRSVVGKSRALLLMGLRLLQILLLFLILAEPSIVRDGETEVKSRLLVMADESASMLENDLAGTPEVLKRNAQALGMTSTNDTVPESSMKTLKGLSRLDLMQRLLARDHAKLWKGMESRREMHFAGFATALRPSDATPTNDWDRALSSKPGEATFLGTALHEAINLHRGTLTEILLFSDGIVNGGIDPMVAAQEAQAAGVRIFPVPMGAPTGNPDTMLLSAAANMMANKGDDVEVIIELNNRSYGGKTNRVELRRGAEILDQKPVTLQSDAHQRVALHFKAQRVGSFGLTAAVLPQPDEKNLLNNLHQFTVRVVDDKYEVLLLEGYPRWEYRFLKNLVSRDTGIKARILLQSEGPTEAPIPDDPKALDKLDVIIIGDVNPRFFTGQQLEALDDFVSRRGGGLILIAGEDFMPPAYRDTPVEKLLPVVLPARGKPGFLTARNNEPFFLKLTLDGDAYAAMRLEEDPLANAQAWARLPGHYWCRTAERLRPAATALAIQTDDKRGTATIPIISLQRYGKGQVLYLAIDSTWRWRHLWGEAHFDRFWGQMIRNIAPERSDKKRPSVITLAKHAYSPGDTVSIGVTAYYDDGRPLEAETLPLSIEEAGSNKVEVVLKRAIWRGNGEFTGEWKPTRNGSYLLVLDQSGLVPAAARIRVGPIRTELDETIPDMALLKQLADITGGSCFDVAALAKLPELLPNNSRKVAHHTRRSLWDNWPLFLLVVLANIGELVLRRRWGLL